jgi:uncharacterized protein (TIGR03067 family)
MKRSVLCLAVLVACVPLAMAAEEDDLKKELAKFQGTWEATAVTDAGQKSPAENAAAIRIIFKGDEYTQLIQGQEVEKGKLKIDPSKNPKTIDLDIQSGESKGLKQFGLYAFEGEKQIVCLAQPGVEKRPGKLESTAANEALLFVLKKVKPE